MRRIRLILTLSMTLTLPAIAACSQTIAATTAQIPLRPELRQCVALSEVRSEDLPALPADPALRASQIEERRFWMRRDWAQADVVKDACAKLGEVVSLVDANNAGPE